MSVALEAVIVGGSAALAVVLTEWLTRIRSRTDEIRRATREIIMSLPHVTVGIAESADTDTTSIGSAWWERQERVTELLGLVVVSARWPQRRARRIRAEADDLSARLAAAIMDYLLEGLRLPHAALLDITAAGLRGAVLGNREPLDREIDSYRRGSVGRL